MIFGEDYGLSPIEGLRGAGHRSQPIATATREQAPRLPSKRQRIEERMRDIVGVILGTDRPTETTTNADARAIEADWQAVGDDMSAAWKDYDDTVGGGSDD